jgi:hypothetical protein
MKGLRLQKIFLKGVQNREVAVLRITPPLKEWSFDNE